MIAVILDNGNGSGKTTSALAWESVRKRKRPPKASAAVSRIRRIGGRLLEHPADTRKPKDTDTQQQRGRATIRHVVQLHIINKGAK